MLLFKKKFLAAIRDGQKTQTIRLWKFRKMRAGQRSYIPGVGYIGIETVEEVSLDNLTDADAIPDGFPTAEALRAEIRALYDQQQSAGSKAFRIRFLVLATDEQQSATAERKAQKAAAKAARCG